MPPPSATPPSPTPDRAKSPRMPPSSRRNRKRTSEQISTEGPQAHLTNKDMADNDAMEINSPTLGRTGSAAARRDKHRRKGSGSRDLSGTGEGAPSFAGSVANETEAIASGSRGCGGAKAVDLTSPPPKLGSDASQLQHQQQEATSTSEATQQQQQPTPSTDPQLSPPTLHNHLQKTYDVYLVTINPGSDVQAKVKKVHELLYNDFSFSNKSRASVVALSARAGAANKMISIVEIVKRELDKDGYRWWQYNLLEGRLEALGMKEYNERRKTRERTKGVRTTDLQAGEDAMSVDDGETRPDDLDDDNTKDKEKAKEDQEEAKGKEEKKRMPAWSDPDFSFSALGIPERYDALLDRVDANTVRQTPVLTSYLSRHEIPFLKTVATETQNCDLAKGARDKADRGHITWYREHCAQLEREEKSEAERRRGPGRRLGAGGSG